MKYNLHLHQDLKLDIVKNMKKYGGSFVKAFAECLVHADTNNLIKLELEFSDYIEQYHPDQWKMKVKK